MEGNIKLVVGSAPNVVTLETDGEVKLAPAEARRIAESMINLAFAVEEEGA